MENKQQNEKEQQKHKFFKPQKLHKHNKHHHSLIHSQKQQTIKGFLSLFEHLSHLPQYTFIQSLDDIIEKNLENISNELNQNNQIDQHNEMKQKDKEDKENKINHFEKIYKLSLINIIQLTMKILPYQSHDYYSTIVRYISKETMHRLLNDFQYAFIHLNHIKTIKYKLLKSILIYLERISVPSLDTTFQLSEYKYYKPFYFYHQYFIATLAHLYSVCDYETLIQRVNDFNFQKNSKIETLLSPALIRFYRIKAHQKMYKQNKEIHGYNVNKKEQENRVKYIKKDFETIHHEINTQDDYIVYFLLKEFNFIVKELEQPDIVLSKLKMSKYPQQLKRNMMFLNYLYLNGMLEDKELSNMFTQTCPEIGEMKRYYIEIYPYGEVAKELIDVEINGKSYEQMNHWNPFQLYDKFGNRIEKKKLGSEDDWSQSDETDKKQTNSLFSSDSSNNSSNSRSNSYSSSSSFSSQSNSQSNDSDHSEDEKQMEIENNNLNNFNRNDKMNEIKQNIQIKQTPTKQNKRFLNKTIIKLTIQTFFKRIESPLSIEEYRELWNEFGIYLNDLKEYQNGKLFNQIILEENGLIYDSLWKNHHFPQSSFIVNRMDKELFERKKFVYKLLFDSDWIII